MKILKKFFVFIFVIFISSYVQVNGTNNSITICKSPEELVEYFQDHKNLNSSTLVIFDIDDTLLMNKNPLLTSASLDKLINAIRENLKCEIIHALSWIDYALWKNNDHLGSGTIVSSKYLNLIQYLEDKSTRLITLTKVKTGNIIFDIPMFNIHQSFSYTYEERRLNDLNENGIFFEKSFPQSSKEEKIILNFDQEENVSKNKPIFLKGVVLTGDFSKRETLTLLFKTLCWNPKNIIFIDNSLIHLESVRDYCIKMKISYEGIHFTYVNDESLKYPDNKIRDISKYLCANKRFP